MGPTRKTQLLSALRATVTDASPHYIGSVTLSTAICVRANLSHRQLVQIRIQRTQVDLWTYVIVSSSSNENICCVNGAASRLVTPGDIVVISAYGLCQTRPYPIVYDWTTQKCIQEGQSTPGDVDVDVAIGKIHRPRITSLSTGMLPSVKVDEHWMREAGLNTGQQVHLVNIRNGRRDIVVMGPPVTKTRGCEVVCDRLSDAYVLGDVIIIMAYSTMEWKTVKDGRVPPMRISFPYEMPTDERDVCTSVMRGPAS